MPTGAAARAAALLRAAEAGATALAEADAELARERVEIAAGLRAEAPDPARAGTVEALPNGTRLHHCRVCGRLAAWGSAWRWTMVGTAVGSASSTRDTPDDATRGNCRPQGVPR